MQLVEPIRLIIWDLDDTFWAGTLSEGGIKAFHQHHHTLVTHLAARGIMSSICSKNDHDTVRAVLEAQGLWDKFVFPSIDWSPKGARVAAIIAAMGLRPATVMFIDDNSNNRAEVTQEVPGIIAVSEGFIPQIAEHPMFVGKDDSGFTRLAQYKLLEEKKRDELQVSGDNLSFLRACDIRVSIDYDVEQHIDRVIELISRTNQLNFTKQRLSTDAATARAEILKQIRYFGHQAGLVKVSDRYGDYGFVGFYLKVLDEGLNVGRLLHFCFSCRTLGMGIEQFVYQMLGRPWFTLVGDVVSDVKDSPPVDWINQIEGQHCAKPRLAHFSEIRLRGGCEMAALSHYFRSAGSVTCVETNFSRGISGIKLDTAASLVNALQNDPDRCAALARLDYPAECWTSDFFAPVSGPTLLVLNLWGDLHIRMYRHKETGFFIHPVMPGFMGWDKTEVGNLAAWTDDELAAQADADDLPPAERSRLFSFVGELRQNYTFEGHVGEEQTKANLRVIADAIPAGAVLALVLPSRFTSDGSDNGRNADHARWCQEALAGRSNVHLIDIDRSIHDLAERSTDIGDHFDRIVYYRVAEEIMTTVA
jgi:FkbH-like protein